MTGAPVGRRGFIAALLAVAAAPAVVRWQEAARVRIQAQMVEAWKGIAEVFGLPLPKVPAGRFLSANEVRALEDRLADDVDRVSQEWQAAGLTWKDIDAARASSPALRLLGALLLAFLWSTVAYAGEPCKNDAGLEIVCPDYLEEPAVVQAPPSPAPSPSPTPTPSPSPSPDAGFKVDAGGGVIASLSSETSKGEPTAELALGINLVKGQKNPPRGELLLRYGALPGVTPNLSDPTTFRAFGAEASVSKALSDNLVLKPSLVFGADFRFNEPDVEPRHRAARFFFVGFRIDGDRGFLFLGAGGDERLSTTARDRPSYLPAGTATWRLKVGDVTGNLAAYITGRVVLFLRLGYTALAAGSDIAQLGGMLGWGNTKPKARARDR